MNSFNLRGSGWATDGQRYGVVAVILRGQDFLTIRRSKFVSAPRTICFPGGGIEAGESEPQAVIRELYEELGLVDAVPIRRLWRSVTRRSVRLAWWLVETPDQELRIDHQEVESSAWRTAEQILAVDNLLESNRAFFAALQAGHFSLEKHP